MVQTQFEEKIQVFRNDNGKEYFNKILGNFFFQEKGIVHQSSCNDTPQQNGVAERKNRHLEIAKALLFSTKTPTYLWGEAILIATFFINRMPTRVLHFQKPVDVFKKYFPTSRLITNILLKKF